MGDAFQAVLQPTVNADHSSRSRASKVLNPHPGKPEAPSQGLLVYSMADSLNVTFIVKRHSEGRPAGSA